MGGAVFLVLAFIVLAIVVRLIAGSMDEDRVGEYIRARGGRLLSKEWAPFGSGWGGEKDSRIYRVTYEDAEGRVHRATCKTSAFSGVYFTEDEIVGASAVPSRRSDQGDSKNEVASDAAHADVAERIRRLDRLRAEALITPEEHAEQRRRILEEI